MKFTAIALLAVAVEARHHHHHHHEANLLETQEAYDAMNTDQLLVSLESKLDQSIDQSQEQAAFNTDLISMLKQL